VKIIYTSYFGGVRKFNLPQDKLVSISQWPPKGYTGEKYKQLAPTPGIIKDYKAGKLSNEDYVPRYIREVLDKLDPIKVYHELNGKILLCYEKSEDFCHRHLVWRWFLENNCDCEEWEYTGDTDRWLVQWP